MTPSVIDLIHLEGVQARFRQIPLCVPFAQIRYFQADAKYVEVHHETGLLIIDRPLCEACQVYGEQVVQIHRGTAVVRSQVEGWTSSRADGKNTRVFLRVRGVDDVLAVSRRFVSHVKAQFPKFQKVPLRTRGFMN